MSQDPDAAVAAAVDARIARGPVTPEIAKDVRENFPTASGSLARWLRSAAVVGDWRKVERFANLGAALRAPGLGEVIADLLDANQGGLNQEDLVDILGEVKAVDTANTLFRVVKRSLESDAPAYWLCKKAIFSLSELETDEANRYLRDMVTASWPNPIRWHTAVALCVEDELGFDEDSMLN